MFWRNRMSAALPPPLAGLKVLDLSRLLPGPLATMHLADLGASVIKIEDTAGGDGARRMGPAPGDAADGDSLLFKLVNRNKQFLRLDLKQAEGVAVFMRLARDADVVVEGFRPGVVDRLGIGYAAVHDLNPRLVYASITGYGQDGPWRDRAGHDINYLAVSGVLDQIGTAGGPPVLPNIQLGDLLGGALTALTGLLAAVIGARVSGQGRHVDVAMTDGLLAHAVSAMVSMLATGRAAPRGGDELSGAMPCYGVYRCADDRYLALGAIEPKFWRLVCATLERRDLLPFGTSVGDEGQRAKAELAALFAGRPLAHWTRLFAVVDCCVTPVLRLEETLGHEQIVARGMVTEVDGIAQFAPPWRFGDAAALAAPRPPRAAGADNAAVLAAHGYSPAEIAALANARVI
jgi:alpha-methylacyl-CoA racemase